MPDLKLQEVLERTAPEAAQALLAPYLDGIDEPPHVDMTRLQPPVCYWVVYQAGDRRITVKTFFAESEFARYAAQLEQYYGARMGDTRHDHGGLALAPELNTITWSYPFDPAIPDLYRCLDVRWVAGAAGLRTAKLQPEVLSYNPEVGSVIAYRDTRTNRVKMYGKATTEATCGLIWLVMDRLYRSEASATGALRVARPLAFRPEAGLLLQAPVAGKPLEGDRNTQEFLDLARAAGTALAGIHGADVPFGTFRGIEDAVDRLAAGLNDTMLLAPDLHPTLRLLVDQLRQRAPTDALPLPLPSHGDYKWDQFLVWRGQHSLIDFELFCQAEPALDVGYFCGYLPPSTPEDWQDAAASEVLRREFIAAYRAASDWPLDMARVGLHEAATLGIRALSYIWGHQPGWQLRASQLLDLAVDRLVDPEPKTLALA
ncbi:MAG TPA: phosphotransferase [Chloroflexota bacterium]|nr:phosphotransferase [Chloroflexota bacterium]